MDIFSIYAKIMKKMRGHSAIASQLHPTAVIYSGSDIIKSTIGRYSYVGYDCKIAFTDIGAFCSMSDHIYMGGDEHPMQWVSMSPVFENVKHSGPSHRFAQYEVQPPRRTTIGNDVWIGHGVSIKAGVSIGNGAVIGTGSVVTKDVPPYAIVAGVPAHIIRYRFDEETIRQLEASQWWELPDDKLQHLAQYIRNPKEFVKHL